MKMRTWFFATLITLCVPGWAAATDLILRQRTTIENDKAQPRESTEYWSANKHVTDDAQARTIVDLGAQTVTMIQKSGKTYKALTFEDLRQQSEAAKKQLENLPPQAKEVMAQMLGSEAELSVKSSGKTEKIAGYETKEYLLEGSAVTVSVWVTEAIPEPQGRHDAEKFVNLLGGPNNRGVKIAAALTKVKGLPLRTITKTTTGPRQFTIKTEVIEVSQKTPPADVLTIPAGFEKIEIAKPPIAKPDK